MSQGHTDRIRGSVEDRGENLLRGANLSKGPDLFRPGSRTCRGPVTPLHAFVVTRFAGPDGSRVVVRSASVGHEAILPEPAVLAAMFGPNYAGVTAPARYTRLIYGDRDLATGQFPVVGQVDDYDTQELRRLALVENMLGRHGLFGGTPVVMLWNQPPGWVGMVREVVERLGVPDDGVVTVGTQELGLVRDILVRNHGGAE